MSVAKGAELCAVLCCPVCSETARIAAPDAMPAVGGFEYLKHPAAALGLDATELTALMSVYECVRCGTYYLDPWFPRTLAASLFVTSSPDHIAGWSAFWQWIEYDRSLDLERELPSNIYVDLHKKIGGITSYAEFGCPFQGFFMRLVPMDEGTKPIARFACSLTRLPDTRWPTMIRIHHTLNRMKDIVFVLGLKTLRLKRSLRRVIPHVRIVDLPTRRVLLTEDSHLRWGANCTQFGQSCRFFASSSLGVDVLPLDAATKHPAERFDLIGIFNSLDHSPDPLKVLQKCLTISRNVVISGHRHHEAARQHAFAFGDSTIERLATLIGNVDVTDLTLTVDYPYKERYFCYLLTLKS